MEHEGFEILSLGSLILVNTQYVCRFEALTLVYLFFRLEELTFSLCEFRDWVFCFKSMFFQPGWEDLLKPDSPHKKPKTESSQKKSSSNNPRKASSSSSKSSSDKGSKLKGKGDKAKGKKHKSSGVGKGEESGEGAEQDKRGVADLVVKYLTPHYKAGRFANKVIPPQGDYMEWSCDVHKCALTLSGSCKWTSPDMDLSIRCLCQFSHFSLTKDCTSTELTSSFKLSRMEAAVVLTAVLCISIVTYSESQLWAYSERKWYCPLGRMNSGL